MKIGVEEVRHVAALARLQLSADEERRFTAELGKILEYVEKIADLDVSGVPPTDQVFETGAALRRDEVLNDSDPERLLANAPDRWRDFFRVPKIVE